MHILVACHDPRVRDAFLDTLRGADLSVIAAPPDGKRRSSWRSGIVPTWSCSTTSFPG